MGGYDDNERQEFEEAVEAWRRQHPEAQEIPSNVIWEIIKRLGYRKPKPENYGQLPE